jgi:hypothetical protein
VFKGRKNHVKIKIGDHFSRENLEHKTPILGGMAGIFSTSSNLLKNCCPPTEGFLASPTKGRL